MNRDEPQKIEGEPGYDRQPLVMNSATEYQAFSRWLPATDSLPSTHEHFIEHGTEIRNGAELSIIYVGVRRKPAAVATEPDNLNGLSDEDLEDQAAKTNKPGYPKQAGKAKRVAWIRAARLEAVPA